jgi:methionyl-tRNA formyltransferase
MISEEVLSLTKMVVGVHPTPLPYNKGRHPLQWMIALGIPHSVASFYAMDSGVDSGRVLIQIPFTVGIDSIESAYERLTGAICYGLKALMAILKSDPNYLGYAQSDVDANVWRKRTVDDVTLDPRMSVSMIKRIVRSFSFPYPGARLYVAQGQHLTIDKALGVDEANLPKNWMNLEHGYIFSLTTNSLIMKVDGGVVELEFRESDLDEKKPKRLHPPSHYQRDR